MSSELCPTHVTLEEVEGWYYEFRVMPNTRNIRRSVPS